MTITVAYLARHGRTAWNDEGRWQGRADSPLTEEGVVHTASLAAAAASLAIDGVFTSPMGRARTTALAGAGAVGLTPVVLESLAEMDHGGMTGLTPREAEARFPGLLEKRPPDKYHWQFPRGESYALVRARAEAALERIGESGCRYPLIVSHEMTGRMLLQLLSDCPVEEALASRQPHDVVYEVTPVTGTVRRLRVGGASEAVTRAE